MVTAFGNVRKCHPLPRLGRRSSLVDSLPATDSDEACIQRACNGDRSAFDQLVVRYSPRLLRMTRALVTKQEDAEDLVQEALARAYFKLPSFSGRSQFFTWLYRIALNLAISNRRKRTLESTQQVQPFDAINGKVAATPPPLQTLEDREQVQQLHAAIAGLEEQRRSVLVLRDIEGLDYDQIAAVLQIPKGTVRSRLHRARCDLKELFVGRESKVPSQSSLPLELENEGSL